VEIMITVIINNKNNNSNNYKNKRQRRAGENTKTLRKLIRSPQTPSAVYANPEDRKCNNTPLTTLINANATQTTTQCAPISKLQRRFDQTTLAFIGSFKKPTE